ncbi:MAG: ATP-binding cassette domain-containing protein, partial [Pseudomonadota bacterium]
IKPIEKLENEINTLEVYYLAHAVAISQTDANNFIQSKKSLMIQRLNDLKAKNYFWDEVIKILSVAEEVAGFISNYYILANEINSGNIHKKDRWKYLPHLKEISSMILWDTHNKIDRFSIDNAIDRVSEIYDRIKATKTGLITDYKNSSNPGICIKNFSIEVNKKTLLNVNDLCLFAKNIALMGENGCGKSTFLKIIKGLDLGSIEYTGNIIYYGKKKKIVMISQEEAIIPGSTLLELITLESNSLNKNKAVKLLKAFSLNQFIPILEEVYEWNEYLSGGQKQLLAIIRLILAEPEIALLDEVFKELDSKSIATAKHLFKEYLPDTQFIITDHEANAHNHDGFYNLELKIVNQSLIYSDLD